MDEVESKTKKLYDIIMEGHDPGLKSMLENAMQFRAEERTWRTSYETPGSEESFFSDYHDGKPPEFKYSILLTGTGSLENRLKREFGNNYGDTLSFVCQKKGGIFSDKKIVLSVGQLARELPPDVLFKDFKFDPASQAKFLDVDFDDFKNRVKKGYLGTYGTPNTPNFTVFIDPNVFTDLPLSKTVRTGFEKMEGKHVVSRILGFSGTDASIPVPPITEFVPGKTIDMHMEESPVYRHLIAKGVSNPRKTLCFSQERNPVSLQVLASIINFQGASHYLLKEQQK
jgi:hypothetical protein